MFAIQQPYQSQIKMKISLKFQWVHEININ